MKRVTACLLTLFVSGCDYLGSYINAPVAPKTMWFDDGKDGQTLLACMGEIRIIPGEAGYQISFTDADGLTHTLYGIKRFSVSDVPQRIKSNIPYPEPDLYNFKNTDHSLPTYSNGTSVQNGNIVVWQSGEQAKFVIDHDAKGEETGRHWERTWIHNKVCDPTT